MSVTRIRVPEEIADRLHDVTTPTPCQVADARMVVVDILGGVPSWPLGLLVDLVCEAYGAFDGERLALDLRGRESGSDEDLRDEPALQRVTWVRATRTALHHLTEAGEVTWSRHTDDPDEVDHPEVEVHMTGGPHAAVIEVGDPLPDGSVSLA